MPGADWRHPTGPGSTTSGLDKHPVTHVAYSDAVAYADWAGKQLPHEAQWEFAARGGLESATFAWGDEFAPRGRMMANTWQGDFPMHNDLLDGYERTSPVGKFPPNGYGLFDVTGNVWEWTTSQFALSHADAPSPNCCGPQSSPGHPQTKVIKGGSHLCAPSYCLRYRPAAQAVPDRRHVDQPPRLSLHPSCLMGMYGERVLPRIIDRACGIEAISPLRRRACEGLTGDVIEIGFGSGHNVAFYPSGVSSVTAIEPSDLAWSLAQERIAASPVKVVRAGLDGQALPFPDDSFDSALSTWTMCSIPDLHAALLELRRVLRPGGTLHYVEHG